MSYAQWIVISIQVWGATFQVRNASLSWGKFYQNNDWDDEVPAEQINRIVIAPGGTAVISSCGREDAAAGTEGSFDIYDGPTRVGTFNWNSPWGFQSNALTWTPASDNYITQLTGGNTDSGAIGNVRIRCIPIPQEK